jgi:hypothetical protein
MNLSQISTIVATTLGLVSFVGGAIAYVRASTRKQYAAERDMNHFKNNQRQLKESISLFAHENEQEIRNIHEQLIGINSKIDFLINSRKDGTL